MAHEIDLLNTAATQPFETCEAEWGELLRVLRLGLQYVPAIQAVLNEMRWQSQPNPIAYVRKAAVRTAMRMGIVDVRPKQTREILTCDLHCEDEEGQELGHDDKLGLALHAYTEEFGKRPEEDVDLLEDRIADPLVTEELEIDWERAGELAGLDAGERIVLDLQLIGFGREAALRACLTDVDRRFLQAAWKRFYRNKQSLSAVLESGENTARQRQTESAEIELVFVDSGDGGLKISFRKSVPEQRK